MTELTKLPTEYLNLAKFWAEKLTNIFLKLFSKSKFKITSDVIYMENSLNFSHYHDIEHMRYTCTSIIVIITDTCNAPIINIPNFTASKQP